MGWKNVESQPHLAEGSGAENESQGAQPRKDGPRRESVVIAGEVEI